MSKTPTIREQIGQLRQDYGIDFKDSFNELEEDYRLRMLGNFDDAVESLISQSVIEARIDEVKKARVGKVTNLKNKANVTYMSGFGYAKNNLMTHISERIEELKTLANKGGES